MFEPQLAGYWGEKDHGRAMNVALAVTGAHPAKIDGIKISLLDRQKEIDMRRRLPAGVRMYTGDDFNYPELIEGDREGHSDALLGIFDAIAPAASAALARLASGDAPGFREILAPRCRLRATSSRPRRVSTRRASRSSRAERPPGAFRHGRRPAVGALGRRSRGNFPPCRCGRVVATIPSSPHPG